MEDSSKLSSKQKGNILEKRFIELVALGSRGRISCYTPDSDDDGIDIIVNLKSEFRPLFIQVKSRFNINSNGTFTQDIGTNTFRENKRFYLCFFLYDMLNLDIQKIWFVPSIVFKQKAVELNPVNYAQKLRFTASPNDNSNDQWSEYRIKKNMLGNKILGILENMKSEDC